jgi:hypothetical protein
MAAREVGAVPLRRGLPVHSLRADRPAENCQSAGPFSGPSERIGYVVGAGTYQRDRRGSNARETRTTVPQPIVYQTAM